MSSFTQLHHTSWWQPLVQRTAPQGTLVFYEHCSHKKGWKTPGLHLCRTLDIQETPQETLQETLQVVSFLVFLPENPPVIFFTHPYAPHDVITTKTMRPSSRTLPQLHCVQILKEIGLTALKIQPLLYYTPLLECSPM